jgi:hypothetical protein
VIQASKVEDYHGYFFDMGVMERSRCSGEMLNNPTPFPRGTELCPAPFSVEHSFLFLFGVLHNSSCSGKKKKHYLSYFACFSTPRQIQTRSSSMREKESTSNILFSIERE